MEPLRAIARRRPELVVLLAFALTGLTLLAVLYGGAEILEGDTRAFDRALLIQLRHATEGGAFWKTTLRTLMQAFTALGSTGILVIVVAIVVGFLLLAHRRNLALLLIAATGSGGVVSSLLKRLFDRPRPDVIAHLTSFGSASLPSGHAMNSAVVYLTLAGLVVRIVPTARLRIYTICCAVALTAAIGISRVYLGVHWPTDVVVGWVAGAVWALLWWAIAWWFVNRSTKAVDSG
ncbi:phosphatase PAP2 family protein [Sphingomonas azotifigens]|uniref:phosphatase PAP2 family protein n=1 Tax=Sphingomonas azotifigens TaxID=330920 RepID=UPI001FEC638C|nr:phosphatase PAP2 family protein [Sphingomonas azotifigens]